VVICLERGADLHMAQRMPLPLTASYFSEIQIGFTFLVPDHPGSLGKGPLNGCVCVTYLFIYPVTYVEKSVRGLDGDRYDGDMTSLLTRHRAIAASHHAGRCPHHGPVLQY